MISFYSHSILSAACSCAMLLSFILEQSGQGPTYITMPMHGTLKSMGKRAGYLARLKTLRTR